jgi:hypothetical protein
MLAFNRLRIDPGDGSTVVDYRIENGFVEKRTLEAVSGNSSTENAWHRLTPEELGSHVMADTILARWLSRRMGIRKLIRACTETFSAENNGLQDGSHPVAA